MLTNAKMNLIALRSERYSQLCSYIIVKSRAREGEEP